MNQNHHNRLRTPDERVGTLAHNDLPPPAAAETSESVLVEKLKRGDERAFGLLVQRYSPAMLRLARRHVASAEEAEEVVQDTWLAVFAGLDRFEGRSSLRSWIFSILLNRARSRGKREARVQAVEREVAPTASSATGAAASLILSKFQSAIADLPPRQREVIVLRDLEGRTATEACQKLGITPANQRVLLHRARKKVRERLAG